MSLELVPLCAVDVTLSDPIMVGAGPAGTRLIAEVEDAVVTGERLSGRFTGRAGADWLLINGSIGTLDVRAAIETDDGALVYGHYNGRVDMSTWPGAATLYVAPLFETGDERYAWLNMVQAVGKGLLEGNSLHYEWYEAR